MSILGYLLIALAKVVGLVINIYTFVVIAAALITWVSPDPYNPLVRLLTGLTEPVFRKVRHFLPRALLHLRIDISPVIVLIALSLLDTILTGFLYDMGGKLLH